MTEGECADCQKTRLAEGYLAGIPDKEVLSLNPDCVNGDNGYHIDDVFRGEQGEQDEEQHKSRHPDTGPEFSNELQFLTVAFDQIHQALSPTHKAGR